MNERTGKMWRHFHEAFDHHDAAFHSAEQCFAEAERLAREIPATDNTPGCETITVRFNAATFRKRWRLTLKFIRMSAAMLFTGKATLRYRRQK